MCIIKKNLSLRNSRWAIIGLQDLCDFVKSIVSVDIVMLEIGSFSGVSTSIFASNFKNVYAVDPWKSGYDDKDLASNPKYYDMREVEVAFDIVVKESGNIFKKKMTSKEAVNHFDDKSLDFVYVDGCHQYDAVKEDIRMWLPKLKDGRMIGGHDFGSKHFPKVRDAVLEELGEPDATFRDSSWLKIL